MHRELGLVSLLLAGDRRDAADRLGEEDLGPARFAEFVDRQGLAALVRCAAAPDDDAGRAFRGALPSAWLEGVERDGARRAEHQRRLLHELAHLTDAFDAAGIDTILLKGPYAALRFHGGLERRTFADLDLLVAPSAERAAEDVLATQGFARRSTILLSRRLTMRYTHALDFAGRGILVDLHWRLFPHPSFRVDEERWWREPRSFAVLGRNYRVLPEDDDLRFAIASLFRDLERGAARVKHLVDLYRMLETLDPSIEWEDFLEACRRERLLRVSVNVLHLALGALRASERLDRLASALERHRHHVVADGPEQSLGLLSARPGAPANKRWATQVYECSTARAAAWWAASLPFRLAVHQPGKVARFRKRMRGLRPRWATRPLGSPMSEPGR